MRQPGISVVLVTQNSAQGMDRLLNSFAETNGCNPVELIIVDKGSTDNTKQVIARYAQKVFIRLNSLTTEPTDAFCLNLGASKAKYPLLIFFKPYNLKHSSDFDSVINFLEKPSDWAEVVKHEDYFTEKGLSKSNTTIEPVGVAFGLQNASEQKLSVQFMSVDDYRRLAINGPNRSIPVFLCKKTDYAVEPFSWRSYEGKAIKQQTVKAYLDKCDDGFLYGWAASSQDDRQLLIDVYVDNQKIASCKADKYRTDLKNHGIWSGRHSFRVPVPDTLRDGKEHNVVLKLENDTAIKFGKPNRILSFDKKSTDVPAIKDTSENARNLDIDQLSHHLQLKDGCAPVTVVIPVFNALTETIQCLNSVIANRVVQYRIVVLDDCSDQSGVSTLLARFCDKLGGIEYYKNDTNLGYTANINKGIALVKTGDVILLNSDTIVTRGWVEKLTATAYSRGGVATVTPLSNGAGAFSIPENKRFNELMNWSIPEDYNEILEVLSNRKRPSAPTGNGFCMYITRTALNRIKCFDVKNFPFGYGEENDFCQKAIKEGLVNLIDDATFIFHHRSASFGQNKAKLVETSKNILAKIHPGYKNDVREWLANDNLSELRSNFARALSTPNFAKLEDARKKLILYIMHDGQGGVSHTTADLAKYVSESYTVLILRCNTSFWSLWKHEKGLNTLAELYPFSEPWHVMDRIDEQRQGVLESLARRYTLRIIHIRHFIGNEPEIISFFKRANCHVVVSLHDMYSLCPTIQLQDNKGKYCNGVCTSGHGTCPMTKKWFGEGVHDLKHKRVVEHRSRFESQLSLADMLVTTSEGSRTLIVNRLQKLKHKPFMVIEHGRSLDRHHFARIPSAHNGPVRLVSYGALGPSKGAKIFEFLLKKNLHAGNKYEFHFIGTGLGESEKIRKLGGFIHGPYQRDSLKYKISEILPSFVLIFSTWPETYCHTLTEAWSMGLPVIATDIGALRERITAHKGGWLVDYKDPAIIWAQLEKIVQNLDDYLEVYNMIGNIPIRTEEQMAEDYFKIYKSFSDAGGWASPDVHKKVDSQ